jgi:hypothetical protein
MNIKKILIKRFSGSVVPLIAMFGRAHSAGLTFFLRRRKKAPVGQAGRGKEKENEFC